MNENLLKNNEIECFFDEYTQEISMSSQDFEVPSSFYHTFLERSLISPEKMDHYYKIDKQKYIFFLFYSIFSVIQATLLFYFTIKIYQKYSCTIVNSFMILFISQTAVWIFNNIMIYIVFFHKMLYFTEIKSLLITECVIILMIFMVFLDFIFSILYAFRQENDDFSQQKQKLYIILLVLLGIILVLLGFIRFTNYLRAQIQFCVKNGANDEDKSFSFLKSQGN